MRKAAVSDRLSKVPMFAGCSKQELVAITRASDELTFPDGHVLTREGDTSREAFVIVSGRAVVKRNGRKVADLGPGDAVGELGLLAHGDRTATVVADGPLEALVIGPREFTALLHDVPSLTRRLLRTLAGTVRDLDSKAYG